MVEGSQTRRVAILALATILSLRATVSSGQENHRERERMSDLSSQQNALVHEMLTQQIPAARATAEALGPQAGPVLARMAGHQNVQVRLLVLELAPLALSVDSSRAVISLLQDSSSTVRSVASSDLAICTQKEVVPDLVKLLEKKPPPELTVTLIKQIGVAGDRDNIKDVKPFRFSPNPDVARQAAVAMARLGDQVELQRIVTQFSSLDQNARVQALRDCQYIGDRRLVKYFGPALDDIRDFMVITPPHMEPVVVARVCDIAVQTMVYMGFRFSFQAEFLARFTPAQLDEAKRMVALMNTATP